MENSIEEDIILLKDFTEGNFKRDKLENYKGSHKMGYFYYKDIQQAIEHILSNYKRVLKEVKRYKNMYEAEHQIHLVRNEQLDRKQKAIIKCNELEVENKELKKENEKLKHKIEGQKCVIEIQGHNEEVYEKLVMKLEKENEELKNQEATQRKINELLVQRYSNSIPIQKVKEIIKELEDNIYRIKKQYSNGGENCNTVYLENLAQIKILKQILKEVE